MTLKLNRLGSTEVNTQINNMIEEAKAEKKVHK